jgi:hypothetical protein
MRRIVVSLFLLAAACASEPIDPASYLPMEEGRSWTFEVREGGRRFRLRHVQQGGDVRELEPFGRIRYDFTYGTPEGEDHEMSKSIWARTPGSPRLYYFDAFTWSSWFDPPLPILPDEPRVGSEWTWAGKVDFDYPDEVPSTARLTIVAEEEVEVPAGRFRAIRVEQVHEDPPVRVTRWLAPGVGLVREVQVLRGADGGEERRSVELTEWSK